MYPSLTRFPGDLFADFEGLQRQVEQLFGASGWPSSIRAASRGAFPAVNVGTTEEAVEIYAFAPGIDPAKIEVSVDKGLLTIAGERVADTPKENDKVSVYARERFVGDPNFDKWDAESYAVGYFLDHRFDDTWSFRQNARFFHNKQDIKSVFLTSLQSDGRTVDRSTFAVVDDSAVFTIDNQAEARFQTGAVAHKLLVGADFQRQQIDDVRGFGFGTAPPLDLYDPVYNQSIPEAAPFGDSSFLAHQVGLYVQDQIKFDRWILTLGGRRDWADSKSRDNLTESTATTKDTDITGRTGLGYAFAFGLTPYVSYSQSFEPVGGTDFFGARFAPTTGTQYEAGLK